MTDCLHAYFRNYSPDLYQISMPGRGSVLCEIRYVLPVSRMTLCLHTIATNMTGDAKQAYTQIGT